MLEAKIVAVCRSEEKGTTKEPIAEGVLREDFGLVGDSHADCSSHRQVSLLAMESIDKMIGLGFEVGPGAFAENLTTAGLALASLPVGTELSIGNGILLEVTQIGKECHAGCAIFQQTGKCIMPKEGLFARVLRGGIVRAGDRVRVETSEQ